MDATAVLDIALWSAQGFLALFFLAAGAPKVLGRGMERWTGFSELPRAQVVFTGFAEVLGAAGLVLPLATGVLPWLTPLAAVGLAIIGLMAAGFHVRADERLNVAETGLLAGIAAAVAIGRWGHLAVAADVSPWVLVVALALLVPAAIINVIVLWTRAGTNGQSIPNEPSRAVATSGWAGGQGSARNA
jgi:DoxX-like family